MKVPYPQYPTLSANFFRGTIRGQIKSVVRSGNQAKMADFFGALREGIISLPVEGLTRGDYANLHKIGVALNEFDMTDSVKLFEKTKAPARKGKGRKKAPINEEQAFSD